MSRQSVENRFFCINCGKEGMSLRRAKSMQRGKFHRKKLYCVHCTNTVNHIECKNQDDVAEFLEQFASGMFQEEAVESMLHVKSMSIFDDIL